MISGAVTLPTIAELIAELPKGKPAVFDLNNGSRDTFWRAARALRAFGMLASVKAYIDALPEDDEMRESWEYAPYFRRDANGIEAARVALGLTVAQVDGLFVAAGAVAT